MLREAVRSHPGCDGIVLGGHGLFTWGDTQRDCYLSSVKTIDQMGEFVEEHAKDARRRGRALFGGARDPGRGGGPRRHAGVDASDAAGRRVVDAACRRPRGRRRPTR